MGFSSISLAGYTNAGKSSLFNLLTEETVPVDNDVFTTLSTTTRVVKFSKRDVLLTDTVGFIDRLPLKLVKAFHSTLEETIVSDVILLVVDLSESEEEIKRKLSCSVDTIQKIGVIGTPIVTVLNKIDLLEKEELIRKIQYAEELAPNPVPISTLDETNIEALKQEITKYLTDFVRASFSVKIDDQTMSLVSQLFNRAHVLNIEYIGDMVNVVFKSMPWFADQVKRTVEKLGGVFKNEPKMEE